MTSEDAKNLKSWLPAKEVQVQEAKQAVETQELMIKQIDDNLKEGFYIKQQEKEIAEQLSESARDLHVLELDRLKRDLESGYYEKKAAIVLKGLKDKLDVEVKILEGTKKKIIQLERNHKVGENEE